MSNGLYILDENKRPVPEPDVDAWAEWFEKASKDRTRIVKQERIGAAQVSTVFLGTDHSFGHGPPVLFETMVFGGKLSDYHDRCSGTWEQAEAMHEAMVKKVKQNEHN